MTREAIKDIKLEYWNDERQQDAICTYSFEGWISHYATNSGNGANHTLSISIQPKLETSEYVKIAMGN